MPRALSLDTLSNEVIAGGFDGFLTCAPSPNITNGTNNIEVRITDLKISNKSVIFDLKKTLCDPLPANAQNIEIQISALDHLHSSVIRYAYRFDDGEWNYLPVGRNSIQIKQFEKGNHTLQIKSTDKNGIWSTNITEFDIFREPYWYETYTAYAIYVLLFVLAIFAIIRYFILRTRKQEEAIWSDSAELVEMRRYLDEQPAKNDKGDDGDEREKDTKQTFTQIDKMLLDKMRIIVEQNISDADFNVASLADHMNMSRSTLMRKIKIITGKTPLQFIRDIKIESACQMLKNRTVSVAEVANRLGYTDSDYFTKTFRESVGMSPSEWQRQNQSTDE
jgi:AraC-like DNA-binding protein